MKIICRFASKSHFFLLDLYSVGSHAWIRKQGKIGLTPLRLPLEPGSDGGLV